MIPAVVQSPVPVSQAAALSFPISFPNPVTKGNLLLLQITWATATGTATPTDNLGSTWQQFDGYAGSSRSIYTFGAIAPSTGSCTITVTFDASRACIYAVYEVNAAKATLDGTPVHSNAATGTSATTGILATTLANSIVFIAVRASAGTITPPGAPWISQSVSPFGSSYQVATTPGNYSATWTVPSAIWATSILAFQAVAGGKAFVNAGGVWQPASQLSVNNAGVWTPVAKVFQKQSGTWIEVI